MFHLQLSRLEPGSDFITSGTHPLAQPNSVKDKEVSGLIFLCYWILM